MIASAVTQIISNLADQIRIYEHLLGLTRMQAEALARRDAQGVHAILQEIEIGMLERGKCEFRRAQLLDQAARVIGVAPDEVTATKLAQLAGLQLGQQLMSAAAHLKHVMSELDTVVSRNKATLEFELAIVDHVVQAMTVTNEPLAGYGRSGTEVERPRMRILDAQV
ncbi:MAG: flagellar protein FlgN [Thermoleophilia bacterium]|nr:flagellar protein FlgN [Thermoleophilia bacterium]